MVSGLHLRHEAAGGSGGLIAIHDRLVPAVSRDKTTTVALSSDKTEGLCCMATKKKHGRRRGAGKGFAGVGRCAKVRSRV